MVSEVRHKGAPQGKAGLTARAVSFPRRVAQLPVLSLKFAAAMNAPIPLRRRSIAAPATSPATTQRSAMMGFAGVRKATQTATPATPAIGNTAGCSVLTSCLPRCTVASATSLVSDPNCASMARAGARQRTSLVTGQSPATQVMTAASRPRAVITRCRINLIAAIAQPHAPRMRSVSRAPAFRAARPTI